MLKQSGKPSGTSSALLRAMKELPFPFLYKQPPGTCEVCQHFLPCPALHKRKECLLSRSRKYPFSQALLIVYMIFVWPLVASLGKAALAEHARLMTCRSLFKVARQYCQGGLRILQRPEVVKSCVNGS